MIDIDVDKIFIPYHIIGHVQALGRWINPVDMRDPYTDILNAYYKMSSLPSYIMGNSRTIGSLYEMNSEREPFYKDIMKLIYGMHKRRFTSEHEFDLMFPILIKTNDDVPYGKALLVSIKNEIVVIDVA